MLSTPLLPPLPSSTGTTPANPVPSTGAALPPASKTSTVLPGAPISPLQAAAVFEGKLIFEEAARRVAIIAGKGLPFVNTFYPEIMLNTPSQPLPRGKAASPFHRVDAQKGVGRDPVRTSRDGPDEIRMLDGDVPDHWGS